MIRRAVRAGALAVVAIAALVAVPGASAGQQAILSPLSAPSAVLTANWSLPAGVSAWELQLSDTPEFTFNVPASLLPTDTTFTAPGPLPPGTYYVRIVTTTTLTECETDVTSTTCFLDYSNIESITIAAPPGNPATLTQLSQSGGVLSSAWTLPAGVESWELEVGTSPSLDSIGYFNDSVAYTELNRDQTSETLGPLPPGTYYVHIISTPSFDDCLIDVNDPLCFLDFSNIRSVTVPAPSTPQPPQPPPPAPALAADKVVSLGAITASSSQDVDKLSITLNAGESVKIKLSGSVNVPGASKVFRFKTVNKSVGAGKTKLSLKLGGKAKKAVRKALKRKKRLKAKLTLVVTDNAGNAQTKKYSVRLKP